MTENTMEVLLTQLLSRLDMAEYLDKSHTLQAYETKPNVASPVVFYTSPDPTQQSHGTVHQPIYGPTAPPLATSTVHQAPAGPSSQPHGQSITPGQETMLPHAFTAGTIHDPTTGA